MSALRAGLAIALLAVATPAVADEPGRRDPGVFEDDRVEVAPARQPISAVTVDNPLGDLRIEGHDGPGLVILSTKRAPDDGALDRLRVSLIPDTDGTMRIVTAIDPTGPAVSRSQVRIDLVVRAPRGARIDGRVRDGRLELANMDAGGELDTARGPIIVRNVSGPIYARSLAGAQHFVEVFGTVDAQAISADVSMDTVRGERLVATVHKGRIQGHHIRARHIELRTTEGDIGLDGELVLGGTMAVASVGGAIDVRLRAGGGLRVRADGRTVTVTGGRDLGGGLWAFGPGAAPAAVELRSRHGLVRFVLVDSDDRVD